MLFVCLFVCLFAVWNCLAGNYKLYLAGELKYLAGLDKTVVPYMFDIENRTSHELLEV